MKLVIKEILRGSKGLIVKKWEYEYKTIKECLNTIESLDEQFGKQYFRFEYVIEGE